MRSSAIRLVVFDIGGVMIDLAHGWDTLCACIGVPYRPIDFCAHAQAEYALLEHELECGRISTRAFATRISCLTGGRYTPEELCAMYLAVIRDEFPGISDVIDRMKAAGIHTACFSNTCELHWPALTDPARYPGIAALDMRHASHLLGARKPDRQGYLKFCQAVGHAPAEILFFDDREENVLGARAFGWQAVRISPERSAVAQISETLEAYNLV